MVPFSFRIKRVPHTEMLISCHHRGWEGIAIASLDLEGVPQWRKKIARPAIGRLLSFEGAFRIEFQTTISIHPMALANLCAISL